ncbi:phospholipase D-like domain-containing protein [Methylobacterium symbioticum]|uniref:Phospholipase D n=1 Tax=Methylobacterium symbioticum TaxID=2584084 RepID=A0A509EGA6_9HYPH|nr:phospholipase D-like domain-containing protein [Methylobacterium symbioticum]VUD72664.1 Cardiolipin synthase B [Methylobacterium symbioticum]
MTIAVNPRDARALAFPAGPDPVWRRERAERVALLHDGAAYFAAARAALVAARRSILLIGWSFDPRTRLCPGGAESGAAGDESLGDLLRRLKAERPDLAIRLLVWTMPWPLSAQSDMTPERIRAALGPGIDYRVDATLPYGACQHQKILVVDDRVAFSGGSDFEANRWDTPAHRDRETRRRLPSGEPYPPRHDVMMLVDGPAARALGDLARERWQAATGETLAPVATDGPGGRDPWPGALAPDFAPATVAIARTVPAAAGRPAVRECEALYLAQIRAARRTIYLENQYFTAPLIARALAARLAEPDGPEIVVVVAECSPNGFDRLTMDSARRGLIRWLKRQDRHGRFRIRAPHTERGLPILVHSKVAIFDDRVLRVGSSNLNNRSFGYDSECDLVVEAGPQDADTRAAIAGLRDRLIAHHAACPAGAFAAAAAERGLCAALDDPGLAPPRRLCTVVPSHRSALARLIEAWHIGDPVGMGDAWRPWRRPRLLRRAARHLLLG